MGKVKETAHSWPNSSNQVPSGSTASGNQLFQLQMDSPTIRPNENSAASQNQFTFQESPQNAKASYDLVLRELEAELFSRSNSPQLNQAIVNQYLALLERDFRINFGQQMDTPFTPVSDCDLFSPSSTPSTGSSAISTPQSSATASPISSPPMSPRSSFSMPRPPLMVQQIVMQSQATPQQAPASPMPMSPMQNFPQSNQPPVQGTNVPLINPLTPLSSGGFIYNFPGMPANPYTFSPFAPIPSQSFTSTVKPVGPAIASKQEKLERYRQKRAKRNTYRPPDPTRRERAQSRTRDERGQFAHEKTQIKTDLHEVKTKLALTEEESKLLKEKMNAMEQELARLRQKAEEASMNQQEMLEILEAQRNMNKKLMHENRLLWSTVPTSEVFSTIKKSNQNSYVKAFTEKIDFSNIELNSTDSPHLEAARMEEDFERRWEEMTFLANSLS